MAFLADLSQVGGRQAGLKAEAEATWQPCVKALSRAWAVHTPGAQSTS